MPSAVGGNLSQAQFGGTQPAQAAQASGPAPTSMFMQTPALPGAPQAIGQTAEQRHHQQHEAVAGESPLPGMANSYGSIKTAAAWRTPRGRVLPLGRGTFGSTFQPFE
jgi:hypothetical protein